MRAWAYLMVALAPWKKLHAERCQVGIGGRGGGGRVDRGDLFPLRRADRTGAAQLIAAAVGGAIVAAVAAKSILRECLAAAAIAPRVAAHRRDVTGVCLLLPDRPSRMPRVASARSSTGQSIGLRNRGLGVR